MNKNIIMPFLGISIIIVIGLIWAAANFFNIRSGMILQNRNIPPAEFDTAAIQADQQDLIATESDISSFNQDDALFGEIDQTSDDISGANDLALDEKLLNEEALAADISNDISALDNTVVQNEIDQSINDVVQY